MSMRWRSEIIIFVLVVAAVPVTNAQQPSNRNLQTCLSGKYPALCDNSRLTPEQRREADAAALRENLRVCLTGKYIALCDQAKLTPEQAAQVREAERAENLRVCSTGKYPALCRHDLLSPPERTRVQASERAENLRACMDGRYPDLCNHSLLSPEQAKDVAATEAKAAAAQPRGPQNERSPRRGSGDCESGHWIEAVEGDGKIIKLENGSLWEVDAVDTVVTSIWLPVSEVIVCDGKLINVDDGQSAAARPFEPRSTRGRRTTGATGYTIQASANDEMLVINSEVFKAKTYCFGFEKGDLVKFLFGSPFGACASATLLHFRTGKTCEVWCE
jgi:hypothetical protein